MDQPLLLKTLSTDRLAQDEERRTRNLRSWMHDESYAERVVYPALLLLLRLIDDNNSDLAYSRSSFSAFTGVTISYSCTEFYPIQGSASRGASSTFLFASFLEF